MTYVFDTSPFSALIRNFYRGRFPSLWDRFDYLVASGRIISTREVRRELEDFGFDEHKRWLGLNGDLFSAPTAEEARFVRRIFEVEHFQSNIELKKMLKGGHNADPFVIAKAAVVGGVVVTLEQPKPNSTSIPDICGHFDVKATNLEQFMETEGWRF